MNVLLEVFRVENGGEIDGNWSFVWIFPAWSANLEVKRCFHLLLENGDFLMHVIDLKYSETCIYYNLCINVPASSEWPFGWFWVTFSGVKWPPFLWSKGHLEEAGLYIWFMINLFLKGERWTQNCPEMNFGRGANDFGRRSFGCKGFIFSEWLKPYFGVRFAQQKQPNFKSCTQDLGWFCRKRSNVELVVCVFQLLPSDLNSSHKWRSRVTPEKVTNKTHKKWVTIFFKV